jgi:photosystem II stability/assembly factor-like uncharacterized protein
MKRNLVLSFIMLVAFSLVRDQPIRASAEPWQPLPGPYGGSVAALALSPDYATDHTLFAGLRGPGVYSSGNGGNSWQHVSPNGWVVIDLAISPAYVADHTLFASFGLWTSGYHVYRSTDEGLSWQDATPAWTGLANQPHLAISPDFYTDHTLFVVGGSQTFVSSDGGDTFAAPGGWFATHSVTQIAFSSDYAADQTLFALVPDQGLYKSEDGGVTWNPTALSGSLSTFAVSPGYATDHMLLAVTTGDGQLELSTDGGDTWSPAALTLSPGGQHTLLFSPTFVADRVILAASSADPGPYRSEDGGATWVPVGWYDPANSYLGGFVGGGVYALALSPNTAWDAAAFAGTSSGIYRSLDRGVHWYQRGDGLSRLTVRALAIAPGDPNTLLAGTSFFEHLRFDTSAPGEYDGSLQLSADGGQTWHDVSGRLEQVQNVAFSPGFAADRTAFAAAGTLGQHGYADGGVYRSTDGGQNWTKVLSDRICHALAISPNFAADRTVWVALSTYSSALGLYVSTDGGDSWASLAPIVNARVLVPSPNYALDHTLLAGTADSGLQRSTDGGVHWSQVLDHPVTALAISPAYGASRTIYAATAETGSVLTALYRSTDGGDSWQLLDVDIPAMVGTELLTITSLAFATDGSLLAGVSYGVQREYGTVLRSIDGGQTWQADGSGLSDHSVLALATAAGHMLSLYAGTSSGVWQLDVAQSSPAEPGTWESGGPRGGRAQALAISPNFQNDGVAFGGEWADERGGGQSGLGIFKSTDGGQTWQSFSSGTEGVMYSAAVHIFAFSPGFGTDQTVFAGTWGGLFRSTDGGATWPWVGRLYSGPFGSITAVALAPDFDTSGHVLAGSGWGGLYASQDGGINWTAHLTVAASSAIAYSPNFAADDTAFAGGWTGLYRTADEGLTWTPVLTEEVLSLSISPQFVADQTLFAGGRDLYISHDEGTSWISTTLPADPFLVNALAISPGFGSDQTLFAGTSEGLCRSTDGGMTWEIVPDYPGLPVRSLAISPGWPTHPVLLAGTDQGVYRTLDGGATWTRSEGFAIQSTLPIALSPGGDLLVTGTYRHGVYGSTNDGSSWFPLGLQNQNYYNITDVSISPAYAADRTMFAGQASTIAIGGVVQRTTDGGATWELVFGTDYIGAVAISPQYAADRTVYAAGAGGRVVKSEDGGDTWAAVGDWPPDASYPVRLVALPANYPADSTLFAAGGQGFWRLPPGATTWQAAATGLVGNTYVVSLAVSPGYAADETLLAVASQQDEVTFEQHYAVFRSTNGGVDWIPVNTGLPEVPLRYVAFSSDYAADHTAYVTAEDQLYRSLDGGLSWTVVGAPPEFPLLNDIVVDRQGDVYLASSQGTWHYAAPAQDIVIDGGFEAGSGWELAGARPAGYSTRLAFGGEHSLRVGIANAGNALAYSSARQVVTIPADATAATLRCSIYPVSGETTLATESQILAQGQETAGLSAAGDAQYLLLLDPNNDDATVATLFRSLSNAQEWQPYTFDLLPYAGRSLKLHFGVYNNGAGGQTAMYVDDVSLVIEHPAPVVETNIYLPLIVKNSGR